MKIGLVGAFDRNNFGDLLMPIVFERQYKNKYKNNDVDFLYYGLSSKNMEELKSCNTEKLCNCYNNCDIVIIVGGEVLSASYELMYLNLQKSKIKIFCVKAFNKLFPNLTNSFSKRMLNGKEIKPWILDKDKLNCRELIYNTVGGSINEQQNLIEVIKKIDYISVRNNKNFKEISKINNSATLYPDSVTAISKIIEEQEISDNTAKDIKTITKEPYFVFQTDYRNSKDLIDDISEQIDKICNENNIRCILLPIGYAQGHEDQKALKKIKKKCKCQNVVVPRMTNIFETLYILKESKTFIGTSLHGIIVSTSYGVPHMFFTNRIKKLIDYSSTWPSSSNLYTDVATMSENYRFINTESERKKIDEIKEKYIELAFENFENINDIINRELNND